MQTIRCKPHINRNHQVVICWNENENLANVLVAGSRSIVNGIIPHAWQMLINGLSLSKTDIMSI